MHTKKLLDVFLAVNNALSQLFSITASLTDSAVKLSCIFVLCSNSNLARGRGGNVQHSISWPELEFIKGYADTREGTCVHKQ